MLKKRLSIRFIRSTSGSYLCRLLVSMATLWAMLPTVQATSLANSTHSILTDSILSTHIRQTSQQFWQQIAYNQQQEAQGKNLSPHQYYFTFEKPFSTAPTDYLGKEYVNGGKEIFDAPALQEITQQLSYFNTHAEHTDVRTYVFAGRYFLDYQRDGDGYIMPEQERKLIETDLGSLKQIQKELVDNYSTQTVNAVAKKYAQQFRLHANAQAGVSKTIILFYIEAWLATVSYESDATKGQLAKVSYKKKIYFAHWDSGLEQTSLEGLYWKEKITALRSSLTATYKLPADLSGQLSFGQKLITAAIKELNQIDQKRQTNQQAILATRSSEEITAILKPFAQADYIALSAKERIHILKLFSKSSMQDSWLGLGNNKENMALTVLQTTPDNQQASILNSLQVSEADLLTDLIDRFQLGNFEEFLLVLTRFTMQVHPVPAYDETTLVQYLHNERFLSFYDWDGHTYESGKFANLYFTARKSFHWKYNQRQDQINAFEYLLVRFEDNFSSNGRYFAQGDIYYFPAIAVYGMFNEVYNRKTRLFIDGVLLATGIGSIVQQTGTKLTLAILDAGIVTTDLVLNVVVVDELNATTEGKGVLHAWNMLAMSYGVTQIGKLGFKGIQNAQKLYEQYQVFKQMYPGKYAQSKAAMEAILRKLEQSGAKFTDFARTAYAFFSGKRSLSVTLTAEELLLVREAFQKMPVSREGCINLLVHSDGNHYYLYLKRADNTIEEVVVEAQALASLLAEKFPGQIPIRLLSCSDLASAKAFSEALPNHEVYAIEDLVRVYKDGGVSTIARSQEASTGWRRLKGGQDIGSAPKPKEPSPTIRDLEGEFVQMGRIPVIEEATFLAALQKRGVSESDAADMYLLLSYTQDQLNTEIPLLNRIVKIIPNANYKNPENLLTELRQCVNQDGAVIDFKAYEALSKEVDNALERLNKGAKEVFVPKSFTPRKIFPNLATQLQEAKSHALYVDLKTAKRLTPDNEEVGLFSGFHSENCMQTYQRIHPDISYTVEGKPDNLLNDQVYEGFPVLYKNERKYIKEAAKLTEYESGKFGGKSSFFPINWDEARILQEVEHAVKNYVSEVNRSIDNKIITYRGFSIDGKIEIHFVFNPETNKIASYYPIKK